MWNKKMWISIYKYSVLLKLNISKKYIHNSLNVITFKFLSTKVKEQIL